MAFNSRTGGPLTCFKNFECLFDARQVAGIEVPEVHDVLLQFFKDRIFTWKTFIWKSFAVSRWFLPC